MKLKAVGAILNKVKQMTLLDDGNRQWVGDGFAFYLLPESLGKLNERTACAIFDIQEEKAANWRIRRQDMPTSYDTSDEGEDENLLDYDLNRRILFNGFDQMPATTPDGKVYFLQARYMKPLTDADPLLAMRISAKGQPYIVAKAGMFAEAIIMPMAMTTDRTEWLTGIVNGAAKARIYQQREIGTDEQKEEE